MTNLLTWLRRKAFNESAHPRGQPENAGQFGPGGTAAQASKPGSNGPSDELKQHLGTKDTSTADPAGNPAKDLRQQMTKERLQGVDIKPKMSREQAVEVLTKLQKPGWAAPVAGKKGDSYSSPWMEINFRVYLGSKVALSPEEHELAGERPAYVLAASTLAVSTGGSWKGTGGAVYKNPASAMIEAEIRYRVLVDKGQLPKPEGHLKELYDRVSEPMKAAIDAGTPLERVLPNGKQIPAGFDACPKCSGMGTLYQYGHVASGVCFKCNGNGMVKDRSKKSLFALLRKSKDASGHEHDPAGLFTGPGGGGAKPKETGGGPSKEGTVSNASEIHGLSERDSDLATELLDNGAKITPNGEVFVYHRTSKENAAKIKQTGKMTAKEDGVFFSTSESGQAEGFGDEVVRLKVPLAKLELDDVFGEEAHVRIPMKRAGQTVDVSGMMEKEAKEDKPHPVSPALRQHLSDHQASTDKIHERAATDPSLTYADIQAHVDSLAKLPKAKLREIALSVHVHSTASTGKDALLKQIYDSIANRKGRSERTAEPGKP